MKNQHIREELFSLHCYESPEHVGFPEQKSVAKAYYNPFIDAIYLPECRGIIRTTIQMGFEKPHQDLARLAVARTSRIIISDIYKILYFIMTADCNMSPYLLTDRLVSLNSALTILHRSSIYVQELYALWFLVRRLQHTFEKPIPTVKTVENRSLSALEKKYKGISALYNQLVLLEKRGGDTLVYHLIDYALDIDLPSDINTFQKPIWVPNWRLQQCLSVLQKVPSSTLRQISNPGDFCRLVKSHLPDLRAHFSDCRLCVYQDIGICLYRPARTTILLENPIPSTHDFFERAMRRVSSRLCYQMRFPQTRIGPTYLFTPWDVSWRKHPLTGLLKYFGVNKSFDAYHAVIIFSESIRQQVFRAKGFFCPFEDLVFKNQLCNSECTLRNRMRILWSRSDFLTMLWEKLKIAKQFWEKPKCLRLVY